MSRLTITHTTTYTYANAVSFSQLLLRLSPVDRAGQRVLEAGLTLDPPADDDDGFTDSFGNHLRVATILQPHATLDVTAACVIDRDEAPTLTLDQSVPWDAAAAAARQAGGLGAAPFAFPTDYTMADDAIEAYARKSFPAGARVLDGARDLTRRIHADFTYTPGVTTALTRAPAAFAAREGVCQDFAHIMLAGLRALGLPARYISGYIRTIPPEGQPRLIGADATHAWVAVWDPALGWIEFDPTNDAIPGADYAVLAQGRDYADAAPVTGIVVGSGGQTLSVGVTVRREGEEPASPADARPEDPHAEDLHADTRAADGAGADGAGTSESPGPTAPPPRASDAR